MKCEADDCRKCMFFNSIDIECGKDKKIRILPYDFESYMKNQDTIIFEKYEDDDFHFGKFDDLDSLYIIRKKNPYFINIKKFNEELESNGYRIDVLELNTDYDGDYLLVRKVEL